MKKVKKTVKKVTKPEVRMTNWDIVDLFGTYVLNGKVKEHPRLGSTEIITSPLVKIDFELNVAETLNTIYVLEGN